MKEYYSAERNVQIVIALLKAYNIKKIVASPGTTNIPVSYTHLDVYKRQLPTILNW